MKKTDMFNKDVSLEKVLWELRRKYDYTAIVIRKPNGEYIHIKNAEVADFIACQKAEIACQKAEIEKLKHEKTMACSLIPVRGCGKTETKMKIFEDAISSIEAKAFRKFAEELKKDICDHCNEMFMNGLKGTPRTKEISYEAVLEYIDNLTEELIKSSSLKEETACDAE